MRRLVLAVCLAFLPMGAPASALAQGWICAEGGGGFASGAWAEPVIAWMVAKGQHGKVAILGAPREEGAGADEPDPLPQRFRDAGAEGVADLRIGPAEADLPATADQINQATIIFIRGGSQTKYVNAWKGKKTEAAIRAVFKKGGVVGGTSAGCAVLGEVIYDAQQGSLASRDILRDARHKELSLATGFLELTPGVIFDTHFTERGRLPRLVVMLGRIKTELGRDLLGIGVDARAAFCVSPDGSAEVLGQGSVTILNLTGDSQVDLPAGGPPAVSEIAYTQLVAGYAYDLRKRQVTTRPEHAQERKAEDFAPAAPALRPGRLVGADLESSAAGDLRIGDFDDKDALLNGRLTTSRGQGRWGGCVVQAKAFDDREFLENRVGGVAWALSEHPGGLGVLLTGGCDALADAQGDIVAAAPEEAEARKAPSAMLILDSGPVRSTAQSVAITGDLSEGARQSVALEGARLHLLAPGWTYRPIRVGAEGEPARVIRPARSLEKK